MSEMMLVETPDGIYVDIFVEFIPNNQRDWVVMESKKMSFSEHGDVSQSPVSYLKTEMVILERVIKISGPTGFFLARMGYCNLTSMFLVSKFAEITREGIIKME